MKTAVLTSVLASVSLLVSAQQYRGTSLQPDSVYKANKVHMRIATHQGAPSKAKEIYVFDKEGRPVALIMTDNATGNIPEDVTHYSYNEKGILSAETDTLFRKDRYAAELSELFYGPDGSLTKHVFKDNGHPSREEDFYSSENKEIVKYYRNDTVYREETAIYDAHGTLVRFKGKEVADPHAQPQVITANGKSYSFPAARTDEIWDYTYINKYDTSGNLLFQERYEGGQLKARTTFILDSHGLLTRLNDSSYSYTFDR